MGMSIGEIKQSIAIMYNNELYTVVDCEHVKMARGPAFCRTKLRNLKNAQMVDFYASSCRLLFLLSNSPVSKIKP